MSYMTMEEFNKFQQNKETFKTNKPRVGFFKLENDGDEAVVRFGCNDPSEFGVLFIHPTYIEGKFRKVNCSRDLRDPSSRCPLCEAGVQLQQKYYIKLIEYVRDETTGTIKPVSKIWERPVVYNKILGSKFSEYGNLKNCIFKVKRIGKKGDTNTSYEISLANPQVYNDQLYPIDFSAFEGYEILGSAVLNKTQMEMEVLARESTGFANVGNTAPATQQTYVTSTYVSNPNPIPTGAQQTQDGLGSVVLNSAPRKVQY